MIPKGRAGVKCAIVLSDGQSFESMQAFAEACGVRYETVWRRMQGKGQTPDTIAREKGLFRQAAE